jgi:hypothetical protein
VTVGFDSDVVPMLVRVVFYSVCQEAPDFVKECDSLFHIYWILVDVEIPA